MTASESGDGAGLIPFVSVADFLLSGLRRSGRHLVRILVVGIFASSSIWEGISDWILRRRNYTIINSNGCPEHE